jgi:large subunit ribosomal protein L30
MAETDKKEKKTAAATPAGKAAAKKSTAQPAANKPAAKAKTDKKVRVTLVRGLVGTRESHRATVRGLGLRRINHTVELEDTPAVRGMINKVAYLVKCEA